MLTNATGLGKFLPVSLRIVNVFKSHNSNGLSLKANIKYCLKYRIETVCQWKEYTFLSFATNVKNNHKYNIIAMASKSYNFYHGYFRGNYQCFRYIYYLAVFSNDLFLNFPSLLWFMFLKLN